MKKIIKFLKKIIDKYYYKHYTLDKETLIRQMFPGINRVGDYDRLNIFFKNNGLQQVDEIIKIIGAYYRGEVERLNMEGKFSEVERYQGLVDFCESLQTYQDYVLTEE